MQAEIDSRRSLPERNRLGQFATPYVLAVEIVTYAASLLNRSRKPIRFADPAIGSGSFYSAALSVLGANRIGSAVGVEVDPEFCDAADALWSGSGVNIVRGDFTRVVAGANRPAPPNFVMANPPYVRHHHLTRDDKQRLQRLAFKMTGVEVNGLAGLYVYFVLLATAWMEDHGIAAWLIPSEFMDVNYGAALKRFLTDRVTLVRVHRFNPNDVQFDDALVSSVVLVFRKTPPSPDHTVEFSFGGTMAHPHALDRVSIKCLNESRKWTVFPSHMGNDRQTSSNGDGPTIGDFFRIQRGIATGSNKFFILDRADAQHRGLPARYLRPILPSPRYLKTTVLERADDGYPLMDGQLCVIDCDLPEPVVQTRFRALWDYLQTADAAGIRDGYLVGKRIPWYKQEQREPAPFLCTYMGRGADEKRPFRFIWNQSAAICSNLYLMLHPRRALAALLRENAERGAEIHELLARITGHELRGEGRVYGGGLNKIEPRELGRISASSFVERFPKLAGSMDRHDAPTLFPVQTTVRDPASP